MADHPATEKRTALLIEDNDIIQKVHRHCLEQFGFEVTLADTGYQALRLADQGDYDLILTDFHLPDMKGKHIISAIRYQERGTEKHVPIVVTTAGGDESTLAECQALGRRRRIPKALWQPAGLARTHRVCLSEGQGAA